MNNSVTIDGQMGTIGPSGMVQWDRSRANVQFYRKSVQDPQQTRMLGRPFYVTKEYVRIQHPGERDFSDKPVADDERVKHIFPVQWANFQRGLVGQEQMPEGTPVDILFAENPAIAANLHTQGVHTAEQLAGLSAHALDEVGMGATEWANRARKFLSSSTGGAEFHRVQKQLADLTSQNEVLQNTVGALKTQLDRLLAAQQGISPNMIPGGMPQSQLSYTTAGYAPTAAAVVEPEPEPLAETSYMGPFGETASTTAQPSKPGPRPILTLPNKGGK